MWGQRPASKLSCPRCAGPIVPEDLKCRTCGRDAQDVKAQGELARQHAAELRDRLEAADSAPHPDVARLSEVLRAYRLFLILAGVSLLLGLGVALASPIPPDCNPYVQGEIMHCAPSGGPDWIKGFWAGIVVYAVLVGGILSARALKTK